MTLTIPYTFTPGTKAKSQEVNANFQAIQTEVNSTENNISQMQTNITTLQNGKANINGSAGNTFSVADPINNADAVNKRYFNSLTQYLLAGLIISKADDDYISCTKGSCYDSTGAKILEFTSDISASTAPYNVSATYYVYIIGMSSGGTNTQLLISSDSSSPALPSGYTLYRILGSFTTDSDSNISKVYCYGYVNGNTIYSADFISASVDNVMPDWSKKEYKSWNTLYSASYDGYVWAMAHTGPGGATYLAINNNEFIIGRSTKAETACGSGAMFVVNKGDTYKIYGGLDVAGIYQLMFIPCKGVV